MKQFKTDALTGIIPITLKDFEFISNAKDEMIEAFVQAISQLTTHNSFVLYGMLPSGSPFVTDVSEGWVVINGKIYKFDAQAYPAIAVGETRVIRIVENTMPAGQKLMKPGLTNVDTWYEYKAELISTDTILPDDVAYANIPKFENVLKTINPANTPVSLIPTTGEWENETSNGNSVLQYMKFHNMVILSGKAIKTGTGTIVTNLPAAIRPTSRKSFFEDTVSIGIDGNVIAQGLSTVYFDGLIYYI